MKNIQQNYTTIIDEFLEEFKQSYINSLELEIDETKDLFNRFIDKTFSTTNNVL